MSQQIRLPPEALSPAGDWDAMKAAVLNGADAIYFGVKEFNARRRAANFEAGELGSVLSYLHGHNAKGYLAVNTLPYSGEMERVARLIAAAAEAGADALIVQDLGVLRLARALAPGLPLHASTQMTVTDEHGARLARELGAQRVILARELSVEQITRIARVEGIAVEVFVHGSLCVSYSGQCLASEAFGGRSANRGECAQPCRLPYGLIVGGQAADLGERRHLLSMNDLCAIERIPDLLRAGVCAFKIEGRLKSAEYVAAATRACRQAIDAAMAGGEYRLSAEQRGELEQAFSRGGGAGYLDGVRHGELVDGGSPRPRGVRVGSVLARRGASVIVRIENAAAPVKPGDGLVFLMAGAEAAAPGGRVYGAGAGPEAGVVELTFGPDAPLTAIGAGAKVWRTDDPAQKRRSDRTWSRDAVLRREPLDVALRGRAGGPLCAEARDAEGNRAEAAWPGPLQPARRRPLTTEAARQQMGRLGDTPYELRGLRLEECDAVMVPPSVLNDLRRRLTADLLEQRNARRRHAVVQPNALAALRGQVAAPAAAPADEPAHLHILARTREQVSALLEAAGVETVWCDFSDGDLPGLLGAIRASGRAAGLATLRICKPGEERFLEDVLNARPDVILCRNLSALARLRQAANPPPFIADFSLNAANELDAAALSGLGARRVTPASAAAWEDVLAMTRFLLPGRVKIILHQHLPMFYMEHCPRRAFLAPAGACAPPCRHAPAALRDRLGEDHPILPDAACRSTVFHALATSAAEFFPPMRQAGVRHFRVELLRESPDQTRRLAGLYAQLLSGELAAPEFPAAWRAARLGRLLRRRAPGERREQVVPGRPGSGGS